MIITNGIIFGVFHYFLFYLIHHCLQLMKPSILVISNYYNRLIIIKCDACHSVNYKLTYLLINLQLNCNLLLFKCSSFNLYIIFLSSLKHLNLSLNFKESFELIHNLCLDIELNNNYLLWKLSCCIIEFQIFQYFISSRWTIKWPSPSFACFFNKQKRNILHLTLARIYLLSYGKTCSTVKITLNMDLLVCWLVYSVI